MTFGSNLKSWFFGSGSEHAATLKLYKEATSLFGASRFAEADFGELAIDLVLEAVDRFGTRPRTAILAAFAGAIEDSMSDDGLLPITVDWEVFPKHIEAGVELRRLLSAQKRFYADFPNMYGVWSEKLIRIVDGILGYLPPTCFAEIEENEDALSVALIDLVDEPHELIERLIGTLWDADVTGVQLFERQREQFDRNFATASGYPPTTTELPEHKIKLPTKRSDLTPIDSLDAYLHATPFADALKVQVPISIPDETRFEHTHILGGTGHGKTQFLQRLILGDIENAMIDRRAIVVIDSQGDLISKLVHLEQFSPDHRSGLSDRLVLIDPTDIEYPVALNMFDANLDRLSGYKRIDQERILNGTIELYEYFFGALLGAELTQKQGVIFKYLARLMLAIPGATIHTLMRLMEDGRPYQSHMEQLDGSARHFFEREFFDRSFSATKKQILRRLWGVLSTPAFERMFTHERNKIDLFDALNRGSVVLVNTAKDLLKTQGSQLFGRFFVAMIAQAALERSVLDDDERTPTFVYIDEAHEYFDENIETILNQARKYNVGLTLAHQNLDQLSPKLRASIMASTSVKAAGGVSAKDAKAIAPDMHVPSEFVAGMRKRDGRTEFAFFAKGVTDRALRLTVPFGLLETQPRMTEEEYEALLDKNRERISVPLGEVQAFEVSAPSPGVPDRPDKDLAEPSPTLDRKTVDVGNVRSGYDVREMVQAVHEHDGIEAPGTGTEGRGGAEHRYLQELIRQLVIERGGRADIESQLASGGLVDVLATFGERAIAFEVSISTGGMHELENIRKCLEESMEVVLISPRARHLANMRNRISQELSNDEQRRVRTAKPEQLLSILDELQKPVASSDNIVRGYTVNTSHASTDHEDAKRRQDAIAKVIAKSLKTST